MVPTPPDEATRHHKNPLVIDLFAGLKGWSEPYTTDTRWTVFTVDNDPQFNSTLTADILSLTPDDFPDTPTVILASPPCTWFSVMRIGKNWTHDHQPKTDKARYGMELVNHTLHLINELQPLYWVIENPRAKLRRLPMMLNLPRHTVTYCQYGESRMKPTDLWGGFPSTFLPHDICANGDSCHTPAPRGSRTGTQGMDPAESAKIPFGIANDMRLAIESDLYRHNASHRTSTPEEHDAQATMDKVLFDSDRLFTP